MNFTEQLNEVGIVLNDTQRSQFDKYFEILVEWNGFMNLTGITEYEEVLVKHFLDSLAVGKYSEKFAGNPELSIIDVGTGAGFPGLPLKIAFPNLKITLLDSLNKRIKFLNEVISQLGLQNVETIHGRAEDFGRDAKYREQYDYCVSRAVANAATLSEYCLPFVKVGGAFVPYKSGKIDEELEQGTKAIESLGGSVADVIRFELTGADADRSLVVIDKIAKTAKKYPRKAGMPSKEPIGK